MDGDHLQTDHEGERLDLGGTGERAVRHVARMAGEVLQSVEKLIKVHMIWTHSLPLRTRLS